MGLGLDLAPFPQMCKYKYREAIWAVQWYGVGLIFKGENSLTPSSSPFSAKLEILRAFSASASRLCPCLWVRVCLVTLFVGQRVWACVAASS